MMHMAINAHEFQQHNSAQIGLKHDLATNMEIKLDFLVS